MSGSFNDREKGFESKFAHDEEMRFNVMARRNKLLGLWAAAEMGKAGDEAQAYATQVIAADFEEPGGEDVFRKIRKDLATTTHSDRLIRSKMGEFLDIAAQQVETEARK